MPIRKTSLVNNYYYHLFNRSVAKIPIFTYRNDFFRALDLLTYYRFKNPPLSFSKLKRLENDQQVRIFKELEIKDEKLIEIICFCFMPNHFHLIVKQLKNEGIMLFLRNFQNSYAKYFNIKSKRDGYLFQNRFKAILIEDNNQLLHLSRYIHLNPYSSFVVKTKRDLLSYQWSSFGQYLKKINGFCQPQVILEQFKQKDSYKNFVLDRADYQKSLEKIKHLTNE